MDFTLAALKLLCVQLNTAYQLASNSQSSYSLGGILFQRAWLQGILVSVPPSSSSSSSAGESSSFLLDDGTGIIEIVVSGENRNRHWETGMYVMVVGGYTTGGDGLPIIKVHKIVDLSAFPDRQSMWYLEVIEAFKLFYRQLP